VRFPPLWSFRRPLRRVELAPTGPDPIDHPAISAMSLMELADLPMWRATATEEAPVDLPPRQARSMRGTISCERTAESDGDAAETHPDGGRTWDFEVK